MRLVEDEGYINLVYTTFASALDYVTDEMLLNKPNLFNFAFFKFSSTVKIINNAF